MKYCTLLFLISLIFCLTAPSPLLAGSYKIRTGVGISFTDPPSPWLISEVAPAFLVSERAASLNPQQLESARKAGYQTPETAAKKMLNDNELFLFNPQSHSHIEIDFSPLKRGENPATDQALKTSARYTAEELYAEEGLEGVKANSDRTRIKGAATAYRVDASFLKLNQLTRFIGVITFARENWVYLYYTGPQGATEDHTIVNRWLESINIFEPKD